MAKEYRYEVLGEGLAVVRVVAPGENFTNVYVLGGPGDAALVDGANPGDEVGIVTALESNGWSASDFSALILTHEHGDHHGAAAALARWAGRADVMAHAEVAWVTGLRRSRYVTPPWVYGDPEAERLATWVQSQPEPVHVRRLLWEGDELTFSGATWQVHHMPGHASGHVVLYDPSSRVAVAGDVIQGCSEARGWLGLFVDIQSQRDTLTRLAGLRASLMVMGHHWPLSGRKIGDEIALAQARLDDLLDVTRDGLRAGESQVDGLVKRAYKRVFGVELDHAERYMVTTLNAVLAELSFQGQAKLKRSPDTWRWIGG